MSGRNPTSDFPWRRIWDTARQPAHSITKVRKGSLIWVSGSLELEEYTRNDGKTHDKRLKLKLGDWDYIPASQSKPECGVPQSEPAVPVGMVDGEREALPE